MYVEKGPTSMMDPVSDVCEFEPIVLNTTSAPFDYVEWYINDVLYSNVPNDIYIPATTGPLNIELITFLGQNSDSRVEVVQVYANPDIPVITQEGNILTSTPEFAYQWLDAGFAPIPSEFQQTFSPIDPGSIMFKYSIQTVVLKVSAPFQFDPVGTCTGDADLNGIVNVLDILSVSSYLDVHQTVSVMVMPISMAWLMS